CQLQENITIECQDAKTWKPDGQADLIMVNNLLHYISPEDRASLFQQLKSWLGETGGISIMTPIHNSKHGKQFSSVFNSFFSAFDNLYPVPTERELYDIAADIGLDIKEFKPVIKEGGWYRILMQK
ncbi:MAG TPA: class I SAM-dependent methyltransferase, partial [Bacillus sp. (in: firmicutes)]|nr:class I SAM-dependent methyltransferase [Bacillus sp. (in: firmicutes)]